MTNSTLLKTLPILAVCLLLAAYVFKFSFESLLSFGIVLLCPLMHIFMTKGMPSAQKKGKNNKACH